MVLDCTSVLGFDVSAINALAKYLRAVHENGVEIVIWAILSLLVKRLRQAWPGVGIVFRGDSGFCRHRMLDWCDRNGVRYIVGLARNAVLEREAQVACEVARDGFEKTGAKSRLFHDFAYAARSWRRTRRVIARIEHGPKGRNPRFVVTNLEGEADELYEWVYCARGDMENRLKEQQLDLFSDRTSSSKWWTNQYRVLLAAVAYTLLETMRRTALRGTELARAQCHTLRLRLLKIGAVVTRNTRTVTVRLSSACPDQGVFRLARPDEIARFVDPAARPAHRGQRVPFLTSSSVNRQRRVPWPPSRVRRAISRASSSRPLGASPLSRFQAARSARPVRRSP